MPTSRGRSDAVRNRAAVLQAAAEMFAETGIQVPMEQIAERANVGVGTVYRHFPSKDALVESVVSHRLAVLAESISEEAKLVDSAGVVDFIRRLSREFVLKHILVEHLSRDGVRFTPKSLPEMELFLDALDKAVDKARNDGSLRADVTKDDLLSIAIAAAQSPRGDRLIELAAVGLQPLRSLRNGGE